MTDSSASTECGGVGRLLSCAAANGIDGLHAKRSSLLLRAVRGNAPRALVARGAAARAWVVAVARGSLDQWTRTMFKTG